MRKMRGDNGEKRCSNDCKTSEGDDPHRPRQPEPEVSTGRPRKMSGRTTATTAMMMMMMIQFFAKWLKV